jgi:hypothetical protein
MEALFIPLMLFTNWEVVKRRKVLVLIAFSLYFLMRIYTYTTYAPKRVEIAQEDLSRENTQWFEDSMKIDYRGYLNIGIHALFILAAFISPRGPTSDPTR